MSLFNLQIWYTPKNLASFIINPIYMTPDEWDLGDGEEMNLFQIHSNHSEGVKHILSSFLDCWETRKYICCTKYIFWQFHKLSPNLQLVHLLGLDCNFKSLHPVWCIGGYFGASCSQNLQAKFVIFGSSGHFWLSFAPHQGPAGKWEKYRMNLFSKHKSEKSDI